MQLSGATTILVAGGAGFIGSNFIRHVLRHTKAKVVCLDALTYAGNKGSFAGLSVKRFSFVKGDITDAGIVARVFAKHCPDFVINFAVETHVDRSIHGGALDFVHTNVLGTGVLLDAARHSSRLKKFVQVSTDEVYGSLSLASKAGFTELSQLAPNSPYAASKAGGDLLARAYYATHALPVVVTRCSNNYGPYQHPEKLIPYSLWRIMQGKPVAIYGDGRYIRDWIHVEDHCAALLLVLRKGIPGEVYNIGAHDELDNLALATHMLRFLKKDPKKMVTFVKDRPGHDRRYAINASKIRKLGWKPKHSLLRDLGTTIAWYLENTTWVRRALAKSAVSPHI